MTKRLRPETMTSADAAGLRARLVQHKGAMKGHLETAKKLGERIAATAQAMGEVQALLAGYAQVQADRKAERERKKT